MKSINNLIMRAEIEGGGAAFWAHVLPGIVPVSQDNDHNPGDETGRLVVEAYRNHGVEGMKSVVKGYQAGYNAEAKALGGTVIRWVQIKNGIGWALPGATETEQAAILAAL